MAAVEQGEAGQGTGIEVWFLLQSKNLKERRSTDIQGKTIPDTGVYSDLEVEANSVGKQLTWWDR